MIRVGSYRVCREHGLCSEEPRSEPAAPQSAGRGEQLDGAGAEPISRLRLLREQLLAAAKRDDAPGVARLAAECARLAGDIAARTPLEACRAGEPDQALAIADLLPPEEASLWYLLVAWELWDVQDHDSAATTLRQLAAKTLPTLAESSFAAWILRHLWQAEPDAWSTIAAKLLGAGGSEHCRLLQELPIEAALAAAGKAASPEKRIDALTCIAENRAKAGQMNEAQMAFERALELVREGSDPSLAGGVVRGMMEVGLLDAAASCAVSLADADPYRVVLVVKDLARLGKFDLALLVARAITEPVARAEALHSVGTATPSASTADGELDLVAEITAAAPGCRDASDRLSVLGDAADLALRRGELAAPPGLLDQIESTAAALGDARERQEMLLESALAHLLAGCPEAAMRTLRRALAEVKPPLALPEWTPDLEGCTSAAEFLRESLGQEEEEDSPRDVWDTAWLQILARLVSIGHEDVALAFAERPSLRSDRDQVLEVVASTHITAGLLEPARATARRMVAVKRRDKVWRKLAEASLQRGALADGSAAVDEVADARERISLLIDLGEAQRRQGEQGAACATLARAEWKQSRSSAVSRPR
jgi:hypothetical protein